MSGSVDSTRWKIEIKEFNSECCLSGLLAHLDKKQCSSILTRYI